jgi:hypothetical protein
MTSPHLLATVLWGGRERELQEATQEALQQLFGHWPEERLADLYALLVEALNPAAGWQAWVDSVEGALHANAARWRPV